MVMPEVIGIEHIYIAVADMAASEDFYDVLFEVLGFRKQPFALDGEPHIQYYNRHFGYILRPARSNNTHDPYTPGLHHFCFRVETDAEVREAARQLRQGGLSVSEPRLYPEYSPDYVAVHLNDPDGIHLEITNYRANRRARHDHWERE